MITCVTRNSSGCAWETPLFLAGSNFLTIDDRKVPFERESPMVEYGPVVIGETTYICPTKSVSISRSRTTREIHEWGETFKVYGPFETGLSDMNYINYHLFDPTSRILPGFTPAPGDNPRQE